MRRLLLCLTVACATLTSIGTVTTVASAATVALPTVSGGFGTTPSITFPNAAAPATLQTKVLSTGIGATVQKGEMLAANYVGQIWRGKVFDSSFSRNETVGFPIGVGAVVKGWDEGLVGQHIGSRVLLVIPPSLGYGPSGNTSAGIKGTDTIVFVIDLVDAYPKTVGTRETASIVQHSVGGVSVSNIDSSSPSVKIASGTAKPSTESTTLLARGSGAKVIPGLVALQYVVSDWTGKVIASTWKSGSPAGEYVGATSAPGVFDKLIGHPIGSRFLIELPAGSQGGPYALEVQVAAEVPASASKP